MKRKVKTIAAFVVMVSVLVASTSTSRGETQPRLGQSVGVDQTAFDYTNYASYSPHEEEDAGHGEHAGHDDDAGHGGGDAHGDGHGGEHSGGHDGGHGGEHGDGHGGGWLLKTPGFLEKHDIHVHGYLNSGISAVANNPDDNFNGVVAFNDRNGELQMNQLWLTVEKVADNGGGWAVGGRIDYNYGTDARFMQSSDGWDQNWGNKNRFYRSAVPQAYVDVAVNDWTFRVGKWFTFLEYEEDEAVNNFFYSHSYTKEYGEPFLHTGALAMVQWNDQLELKGGIHRGWNQFDDTDGLDDISVIGGYVWNNYAGDVEVRGGFTAGEQGPGGNTVTLFDTIVILNLTENLEYVFQTDIGKSEGGSPSKYFEPGEWYGIVNYLTYQLNSKWSAGTRFEWFRDDDGVRVTGHGDGNDSHGNFEGNFFEITCGLNFSPCENVRIRPEIRWDWFDGVTTGGHGPYDGLGDMNEQFMAAIDVILLL